MDINLWHRELTHWGLVTPYGDRELGQQWRHQAITWTNVDLSSVRSCGVHVRTISQEIPLPSITKISLRITSLKFISNIPGANELNFNIYQLGPGGGDHITCDGYIMMDIIPGCNNLIQANPTYIIVRERGNSRYAWSAVNILWRLHFSRVRPAPARNTWYQLWPVEHENIAYHAHDKYYL